MRLFTAAYSGAPVLFFFFLPRLSSFFLPGAGVCALERGDVLAHLQRLRREKMDQEILVPLYSGVAVNATKQPREPHTAAGKGDEKLLPHCCCHLPAA